MKSGEQLRSELAAINHRSYPAYKSLKGEYRFPDYILSIDHVQGDPFAAPSHVSLILESARCGFPAEYLKGIRNRTAMADYLLRRFGEAVNRFSFKAKGSGKSGLIKVSRCGQEILRRSACSVDEKRIIVRFHVGFPANGRTINSPELEKIFFDFLPKAAAGSLHYRSLNAADLKGYLELFEDQEFIREELKKRGLSAFVCDGSVLPRESGISGRPMKGAVPFVSPESLRIALDLPNRGKITGMGIPKGITLIVGGGYHGKSTLLDALQAGVYEHVPGDGREYVITDASGVKLRSEDGRFVKDVDISMFINHLPNKKDTRRFSTEDASGSTSQAAGIIEAIEAGSRLFLLDEDTSATNFMVRDSFMQEVISPEQEPITPFLLRARSLYEKNGISTILVAGSSGAFFHIADTIIQMDNYIPVDIREKVKALLPKYPLPDAGIRDTGEEFPGQSASDRRIMTRDPTVRTRRNYYGKVTDQPEKIKIHVNGTDSFSLGRDEVDLRYIEQIVDEEQMAALADILKYACENLIDGKRTLDQVVKSVLEKLRTEEFDFFKRGGYVPSGLAMPRDQEIYACFNRFRRP